MPASTAKNVTGQIFGTLTAIRRCGTRTRPNGEKSALWLFECNCGVFIERTIGGEFRRWSMAHGYEPHLSIDRINPSRNYEPSNCERVTREENSRRVHALPLPKKAA